MTISTIYVTIRTIFAAGLTICAGAALFAAGLVMIIDNLHIVQTWSRTTGVIVANEKEKSYVANDTSYDAQDHDTSYVFYPVVRFVARDGQTYVVRGMTGTYPPEFHQGEAVTVCYDPRHPQTALIDSWTDLWLAPLLFLGMPAFIVPFLLLILRLRRRRRYRGRGVQLAAPRDRTHRPRFRT